MDRHGQMTPDFLLAIIEHVAHPIFVKDREYRFVLVNRALCEMVGYPQQALLGKTDYDFFPKEQADFFRVKDAEMFTTGAPVVVEQEPITDQAGQVHILATTKVPFRDRSGLVTHLVGIIKDITQITQAEELLRHANEELERRVAARTAELAAAQLALLRRERLAVLGQLAGGLAHQLRNPLGAIENATSLLRKADLAPGAQLALDIIHEEVRRADRTIADLLDYARVRPPEHREVSVGSVVGAALEQERVPERIVVSGELPDEVVVRVDPLQVQSALGNVIRNAIEAMPAAGSLSIRAHADGDRVRIVVRDSGNGVAEENATRLFDPLVTTKPLGIGLGLSTARNLIENQGGSIRYTGAAGEGAEFTIDLPAVRSAG
jgi:PAS domain S-box-containing protein